MYNNKNIILTKYVMVRIWMLKKNPFKDRNDIIAVWVKIIIKL